MNHLINTILYTMICTTLYAVLILTCNASGEYLIFEGHANKINSHQFVIDDIDSDQTHLIEADYFGVSDKVWKQFVNLEDWAYVKVVVEIINVNETSVRDFNVNGHKFSIEKPNSETHLVVRRLGVKKNAPLSAYDVVMDEIEQAN